MGQRSQIYIRYKDSKGVQLVARYFGWNYGERMVSRARAIIEWLLAHQEYYSWFFSSSQNVMMLERLCDVNFDMRDVTISGDIKKEIREQFVEEVEKEGLVTYLFGQDNNDGQLLIDFTEDKIKYAFIPYYTEADKVMSAAGYMEWNIGASWRTKLDADVAEYTMKNIQYISNHARLMTPKEVAEFLACDYDGAVFGYPF